MRCTVIAVAVRLSTNPFSCLPRDPEQFPIPRNLRLSLPAVLEMESDVALHIQQHVALPAPVLLWHEADSGDMTILIPEYNHVHSCCKESKDRPNISAGEAQMFHRTPEGWYLHGPC